MGTGLTSRVADDERATVLSAGARFSHRTLRFIAQASDRVGASAALTPWLPWILSRKRWKTT